MKLIRFSLLSLTFMLCCSAVWADDFAEGVAAYNKQDYEMALSKFKIAASKGSISAQFNLGRMYGKGHGVAQDYAEAMRWYKLAAEQDDSGAQVVLGAMLSEGKGTVQDYAEAVRWYKLAAGQGNSNAQLNLSVMYARGLGIVQDFTKAYVWSSVAAATGDANAVKLRDIVGGKMTSEQVAEAQKLARECQARNFKNCD